MRTLIVLVVVTLCALVGMGPALAAGGDLAWEKSYVGDDPCGAIAVSIATDPSTGTVYSLARNGECLLSSAELTAYSPTGTQKWHVSSGESTDRPVAVGVDPTSHDVLALSERDQTLLLQAWSSSGNKLWGRTYGVKNSEVDPIGLAFDTSGNVYAGASITRSGTGDFLTSAYRVSDGTTLWHVRFDGAPHQSDEAIGIGVDPVKKRVYVDGTSDNNERVQLVMIAYDFSGVQRWGKRVSDDYQDTVDDLAVDTAHHTVDALYQLSDSAAVEVRSWASDGTLQWHSTWGAGVLPKHLAVDRTNGQVYASGFKSTGGSNSQAFVTGFSAAGAFLWTKQDGSGTAETSSGLAADTSNHRVYAAATDEVSGHNRIVTLGYSSAGVLQWRSVHLSPVSPGSADAASIAVDPARAQVYVGGDQNAANDTVPSITLAYAA